ncbi:hypothetical protein EVAR_50624_1 [Eumeta japonica]|uniref:Uncharacterized protein n=1 Tax=Eumeta variegata TaxID=151549 RepID=A0A4C1XKQ6_EUMVA|nr:hypothetical protein EVAR_50624_1 [Eumeta japonica]
MRNTRYTNNSGPAPKANQPVKFYCFSLSSCGASWKYDRGITWSRTDISHRAAFRNKAHKYRAWAETASWNIAARKLIVIDPFTCTKLRVKRTARADSMNRELTDRRQPGALPDYCGYESSPRTAISRPRSRLLQTSRIDRRAYVFSPHKFDREANEHASHLKADDYSRPQTRATPESPIHVRSLSRNRIHGEGEWAGPAELYLHAETVYSTKNLSVRRSAAGSRPAAPAPAPPEMSGGVENAGGIRRDARRARRPPGHVNTLSGDVITDHRIMFRYTACRRPNVR